jgi:uncharacterized protein (TIGR00255 family)
LGVISMTGFAREAGEAAGVSFVWEVKSVNGRSLDLRVRLPAGHEALEPVLRATLASRCRRGTISASLSIQRTTPPAIRVNRAMLSQLASLAGELSQEIDAAAPRLDGLLALRGVIETTDDEPEPVLEARRAALVCGWDAVVDRLAAARGEEGGRLALVLGAQRAELRALVASASACAAAQPAALAERLRNSWASLAEAVPALPEERLAQELALLVTRADIREEIERLAAHLEQVDDFLSRDEPVGRQLDFLCQELNREANTLCSKSADIELTRVGLALKLAVEQFREQVQNIE